jgi:1-acyl-sn-glycerol-3-phosphate acyltransferase
MTQPDPPGVYRVPLRIRLFRLFMRPVFRLLFRILSRVRLTGRENVPNQGAYLIAINHISLFEPPLILAFWPTAPEAVGAVDIWDRRGQSTLARWYGGIPVHRGEYDRALLDRMLSALNAGKPLLIAPEGGRSHSIGMRRALPGVAYVMDKARVPVVPVGITGTSDDFLKLALKGKRPQLEIRIGPPVVLPPIRGKGEERRAARQENVDLVMKQIAALLPEEYHGIYARQG